MTPRNVTTALHNQRGMTLIEIMIVMAIIGSLLAVLGTTAKTQWDKSKVSNAKIQMGELSKALDSYNMDCGGYPPSLDALLASPGESCPNWGPTPYTKKRNIIDSWNHPFQYESQGSAYVLKSLGRDGKEGGEGLDKDLLSEEL